jgi:hypothetical protein
MQNYIHEYVKTRRYGRNEKVGVMVAIRDLDNRIKIGYSQCNPLDKFDADKGLAMATGRALKHFDRLYTYNLNVYVDDILEEIPTHIKKVLINFILRSLKYFKGCELDKWAADLLEATKLKEV